jgi:protein-S-isoprenylcysteine O-methyltransferase Ste14
MSARIDNLYKGLNMPFWLKAIIFGITTLLLVTVSRESLRSFGFHGFYRFFAWEMITALVILNLDAWFVAPLAWHQLISWILLVLSLYLVIEGLRLLRLIGKPHANRAGEGLIGMEKTTQLVTIGVYKYIRHPLYSSLLFLAWGAFFKSPSWIGGILALGASLFLTLTAKAEEAENSQYFGVAYQAYQKHTQMFIPYVF